MLLIAETRQCPCSAWNAANLSKFCSQSEEIGSHSNPTASSLEIRSVESSRLLKLTRWVTIQRAREGSILNAFGTRQCPYSSLKATSFLKYCSQSAAKGSHSKPTASSLEIRSVESSRLLKLTRWVTTQRAREGSILNSFGTLQCPCSSLNFWSLPKFTSHEDSRCSKTWVVTEARMLSRASAGPVKSIRSEKVLSSAPFPAPLAWADCVMCWARISSCSFSDWRTSQISSKFARSIALSRLSPSFCSR